MLTPTLARANDIVRRAYAAGLTPDTGMRVSEWVSAYRVISDGPNAGRYNHDLMPYWREPMDRMSPEDPCRSVTIIKSAQVGASEMMTSVAFFIIDQAPGNTMIVHPTREAAADWTAEKFDVAIDANPRVRAKIAPVISRGSEGSTSKRKRFPGGMIVIAGANSSRALRSRTIRWVIKDDWSDWELEIAGQGDPDKMVDARQKAYTASGLAKTLQISTPTVAGVCRAHNAYEASDQRRWHVPCPDCGHEQPLALFPDAARRWGGMVFNTSGAPNTQFACGACGVLIPHARKRELVALGRWVAGKPGEGRQPGYHLNAFISPLETWDAIINRFLVAKDRPSELKTVWNLDLGLAWEERGDAPEWEALQTRAAAEQTPLGVMPDGALAITVGVDVQKTGFYYEVVAWGEAKTSWSIDYGFIAGDPSEDPATGAVWRELDGLYDRKWRGVGGASFGVDLLAIDTGYLTNQVYLWARGKPHVMAVKGADGWSRAVLDKPTKQGVTYRGEKLRRAVLLWNVYVWSLKSEFYANLRKQPPRPGAEQWPLGYCHFTAQHSERFFKQLTADYLTERTRNGRKVMEWAQNGENHWHDCRIYAMAAFFRVSKRLGVENGDPAGWAKLAARRGAPVAAQPELPIDSAADVAAPSSLIAEALLPRDGTDGRKLEKVKGPPRRGGFVNAWRNR